MRSKIFLIVLLCALCSFTGCQSAHSDAKTQERAFDQETLSGLETKAKRYSAAELAQDEVPLHAYIQLEGTITKTDGKKDKLKKGDRFVLTADDQQYQIFNEQDKAFAIGDKVVVYGEYYGFIKGLMIKGAE